MSGDRPRQLSRRRFLGEFSGAAIGGTAAFSTLLNLQLGAHASAQALLPGNDYKALVCIFQSGGNDSYNMLVPTDTDTFRQYELARGSIALRRDGAVPTKGPILDINAAETDGRSFGVHPAMPEVRDLFDSGALSFVANVGTMVEPLSVSQYRNQSRRVPRALFSHNDQIGQWQSAVSGGVSKQGWGGRIGDLMQDVNLSTVATNISLSGTNIWQTGAETAFYTITADGSIALTGKGQPFNATDMAPWRYRAVGIDPEDPLAFSGRVFDNVLQQAYLNEFTRSVALDVDFAAGFDSVSLNTTFPSTGLGRDLAAIARTIAVREQFGLRRQVFFVNTGSWDHHQELLNSHSALLGEVSGALGSFWDALGELGVRDDVVTFTMSDFGRTLRSNGRGTDHAWGGNHLVMGGDVIGRRIFGNYPTDSQLQLGAGLDIGDNGRMLPTTSLDEYAGELASWFGVAGSDLDYVLPNVRNFYLPEVSDRPIGFLAGGASVGIPRASVATSCVNDDGRFDIDLINTTGNATFVIEVSGMPDRARALGPDESLREIYTGRPDRDWDITVKRNGTVILDTTETVACDPLGPEVVIEQTCLNEDGRLDVFLSNDTDFAVEYEVSLSGLTPRFKTLLPRRAGRVTFTGRPDADYVVTVRRDGLVLESRLVSVACDPTQSVPARVEQSCFLGRGRFDVFLLNNTDTLQVFDVRVGTLAPRLRTLASGSRAQVTVTGRTNGPIPIRVIRTGTEVFAETFTVDC